MLRHTSSSARIGSHSTIGTSFELVEWLAITLQAGFERMGQKHKDQTMIQKSLVGVVDPEEEQEVGRIG